MTAGAARPESTHALCNQPRVRRTCGRRWRSTACSMLCAAWQFLALAFHSLQQQV